MPRENYEEGIPDYQPIVMEDLSGNWVYFRYKEK